jgi:hypothetical protein
VDELDLVKIEHFIFQLYEYFVSFWSTSKMLIFSPSNVLNTLEELKEETTEGATEEKPEETIKKEEPKVEKKARAQVSPDSKASKWSQQETQIDEGRKRRAKKSREEKEKTYKFEEHEPDAIPLVCLPGIFALFSAAVLLVLEWVQAELLRSTVGFEVGFDKLQGELVVIFITLFCTSQFIDNFLTRRGRQSRPRQIFALCCYSAGFLVPKQIITTCMVLLIDFQLKIAIHITVAVQLIFLFLMAVFWIRGVRRIYSETWRGTIRAALNAGLGALVCYALLSMFIFPEAITMSVQMGKVTSLFYVGGYARALDEMDALLKQPLPARVIAGLRVKQTHMRYFVCCDRLIRLKKLVSALEKAKLHDVHKGPKDHKVIGSVIKEIIPSFGGDMKPNELNKLELVLEARREGSIAAREELVIKKFVKVPRPLPEPPERINHEITVLEETIRRNFRTLIASSSESSEPNSRPEIYGRLKQFEFRCHHYADILQLRNDIKDLYWAAQRQRLAYLRWLRDAPNRYIENIVVKG